jgi:hypothetical protein
MSARGLAIAATLLVLALPAAASAQQPAPAPAPGPAPETEAPPPEVTVVPVPAPYTPPPPTTTVEDLNQHLPSSSRASTDTGSSQDFYDLPPRGGEGGAVRGSKSGAYITGGENVPERHTARRGDTLWDLSERYYNNPYVWPRVWSYNKHIQNPHWIYPGDHIRMRGGEGVRMSGFLRPQPLVPPGTIFMRYLGYVLDGAPRPPNWGQVIGSPDDQMLLSEGDQIYIKLERNRHVQVGQLLTLWEEREVKNLADFPLVWIRGVARVNRYNHRTHMVRAKIVESLTEVERGIRVGPADRLIDVVEPVTNRRTVRARIVGAPYPHAFYSTGQIVYIDRGRVHGLEVGNRLFAVSRGDEWRLGLETAGNMADERAIIEDDRLAETEKTPDTDEPDRYPAETYAELRVVRVRKNHATCAITAATRELPRGALVIARAGY